MQYKSTNNTRDDNLYPLTHRQGFTFQLIHSGYTEKEGTSEDLTWAALTNQASLAVFLGNATFTVLKRAFSLWQPQLLYNWPDTPRTWENFEHTFLLFFYDYFPTSAVLFLCLVSVNENTLAEKLKQQTELRK